MSLPPTGPTPGQVTVWLTDEPITAWAWQFLQEHLPGKMTFCSHQHLLQSHLTIRENITLQASLYGQVKHDELDQLLKRSGLNRADQKTCYYQSRLENRLLSYVLALLPNPDTIFVDDLTRGLSPPAQKQIWQFILSEQALRPRTLVYLTSDRETARALGDEIWPIEKGQVKQRQSKAEVLTALPSVTTITLEFKDKKSGRDFQQLLREEPLPDVISSHLQPDGLTVTLQVTDAAAALFDLTWRAGRDLVNFAVLPSTTESISTTHTPPSSPSGRINIRSTFTPKWPSRAALWQFSLSEWRRHFRSFWKAGNLLFSAIYTLLILASVSGNVENDPTSFGRYAPLALVFTAAMIVLGTESIGRLAVTGNMDTLFESAKAPSKWSPFSLLAFYDTTPLTRSGLLFGLGVGQLVLWAMHMALFWAFWIFLLTLLPDTVWLVFVSLVFWLFMALDGLAVAIVLGCLSTRPRQGHITGWLSWFLIVLSLGRLPPLDIPIFWLWPFTGLANAFYYLPEPARFWTPFLLAMVGSVGLWGLAIYLFRRKKSAIGVEL